MAGSACRQRFHRMIRAVSRQSLDGSAFPGGAWERENGTPGELAGAEDLLDWHRNDAAVHSDARRCQSEEYSSAHPQRGSFNMKSRSLAVAFVALFGLALPVFAENAKPVRMGCGIMTFDTVPGWGLGPDGKSVIGSTHGGVVIDKAGNIYTSSSLGVFVFSPDGKVIRRF